MCPAQQRCFTAGRPREGEGRRKGFFSPRGNSAACTPVPDLPAPSQASMAGVAAASCDPEGKAKSSAKMWVLPALSCSHPLRPSPSLVGKGLHAGVSLSSQGLAPLTGPRSSVGPRRSHPHRSPPTSLAHLTHSASDCQESGNLEALNCLLDDGDRAKGAEGWLEAEPQRGFQSDRFSIRRLSRLLLAVGRRRREGPRHTSPHRRHPCQAPARCCWQM